MAKTTTIPLTHKAGSPVMYYLLAGILEVSHEDFTIGIGFGVLPLTARMPLSTAMKMLICEIRHPKAFHRVQSLLFKN
jgi:hypothetical protein